MICNDTFLFCFKSRAVHCCQQVSVCTHCMCALLPDIKGFGSVLYLISSFNVWDFGCTHDTVTVIIQSCFVSVSCCTLLPTSFCLMYNVHNSPC